MKKSIISIGALLILNNLVFGLIISAYDSFNLTISTITIALTIIILLVINGGVKLNDGFNVSLNIIIPIIGIIQYLFALFMPNHFNDNWGLITIILLVVTEVILLIAANSISSKIK